MKYLFLIGSLLPAFASFSQLPGYHDVIIDEIMAHPVAGGSLPNAEFVELKNTSASPLNLSGWKLSDASTQGTISTAFVLQPDSFVLLCAGSSVALLAAYGPCIAVSSFPSLNNDGDQLVLRSRDGKTIHAVDYSLDWYHNPVKQLGGWSLEMIDTGNPCTGLDNWTASTAAAHGTPGKKNAAAGINPDADPPELLRAFAPDNSTLLLRFNEPVDSLSASSPANYSIDDPAMLITGARPLAPFFNQVILRCTPISGRRFYTITVTNIRDCSGNTIGAANHAKTGLAAIPSGRDIVINELLFHPLPDGTDYVELYNRSDSAVDISRLFLATRSATGLPGSLKQLGADNRLLFPGDYLLITDKDSLVKRQYLARDPGAFLTIPSMPSLPNDKGDLVLLTDQGSIIDELAYSEQWQFPLLGITAGVALERIDYNGLTQDPGNWHSAASTAGYGTPGYRNSQFSGDLAAASEITLSPGTFSPDNDGYQDFLTISYRFPDPGYVTSISIYNANGHAVRLLANNVLCGAAGNFRWEGLDDGQAKLPAGIYILLTEVFTTTGKTRHFKNTVVLARKL